MGEIPKIVADAVLVQSESMPIDSDLCEGYDFNNGVDLQALLGSYVHSGYQATNMGKAINIINEMRAWRNPEPVDEEAADDDCEVDKSRTTIFLGYTSNLISCGLRESLRYLAQHQMVDCVVSTAGGIEEDFIKCLAPTYMGDFQLNGADLRDKGINRIGNLLVPNDNYCLFEDWIIPILDQMLVEQNEQGINWTPSKMIHRLGKEINDERSVYYWCYKNNIPVFSPALTDGSIGDMLFFHSFKNPGLKLDIIEDIRRINLMAVHAAHTGMIILGGGLVKHHIFNANLMRNGADYAVVINTAGEYDGSDAGASLDEAKSWGKIKADAKDVKVTAEVTLVWPMIMAATFARDGPREPVGRRLK
ncbi:deoxyhypusine synthase [Carpediemonas membranifera]|uniref:deoxyhypusine synthase n=1 Tax=Carpediemonas membranifera TaxID=201153 RepID=A0A8J6EBD5_9EUKA|nr:deoxyhypusine synthase [Carpediemonas membranifera]|eukprot:KAG9396910.1 deoxyhypusine synthase [Carpediemonas membranifera]